MSEDSARDMAEAALMRTIQRLSNELDERMQREQLELTQMSQLRLNDRFAQSAVADRQQHLQTAIAAAHLYDDCPTIRTAFDEARILEQVTAIFGRLLSSTEPELPVPVVHFEDGGVAAQT